MIKFVTITVKVIGIVIMLLSIVHALIYEFPSAGLGKPTEFLIAFILGLAIFVIPTTTIENLLVKKAEKEL